MSSVADRPPVRHGTCRLTLTIDGVDYRLSRGPAAARGAKVWRLRSLGGPRAGALYSVVTHRRTVSCTCPDSTRQNAVCKHVRALQACGIVTKHHVRPLVWLIAADLARPPAQPDDLASARRRHLPALPAPSAEGGA